MVNENKKRRQTFEYFCIHYHFLINDKIAINVSISSRDYLVFIFGMDDTILDAIYKFFWILWEDIVKYVKWKHIVPKEILYWLFQKLDQITEM